MIVAAIAMNNRCAAQKKAADSSGFEDNFSAGRAAEKCRGKQGDAV
ncbi:hypothetical protein NTD84_12420 [Pseudomonas sp. 14P_8.1_Bac3]|nr:hypothetical protein [Pseudomonas sp. 14P_8.1_Bac3]MCU1760514.1 hypothetical protein [Pseudomonas sp. 14P_8.1_Bac3]